MGHFTMENSSMDNPFASPDFKREVLKKKGLYKENGSQDSTDDYEVLEPEDPIGKEPGRMITPSQQIKKSSKLPKDITTILNDATSLSIKDKTSKSKEINSALNKVFTEYNESYGLNLKLDLDNLANSLTLISDEKNKRILELYISETFGRVKSLIYLKLFNGLIMLTEHLMDPKTLLSNDELTMADKFVAVEKIIQYCDQLEKLQSGIVITGATTELAKLGESETTSDPQKMMQDQGVKDFLNSILRDSGISDN
jgi:hypothetical protein